MTNTHTEMPAQIDSIPGNREWQLRRRSDARLVLTRKDDKGGGYETPVQVVCCFPWSRPQEYVSIRDDDGRELLLIESLTELEESQSRLVEDELAFRNFLTRITRIHAITRQMELYHWSVATSAGARSFLTRKHERPRHLDNGEAIIKDVYNDIYHIPKPKGLDAKSLRLLWVYLD